VSGINCNKLVLQSTIFSGCNDVISLSIGWGEGIKHSGWQLQRNQSKTLISGNTVEISVSWFTDEHIYMPS